MCDAEVVVDVPRRGDMRGRGHGGDKVLRRVEGKSLRRRAVTVDGLRHRSATVSIHGPRQRGKEGGDGTAEHTTRRVA